jgi:hypothetical protein
VLIDFHVRPQETTPAELAAAAKAAGLDGVAITDRHSTARLDAYLDALEELDLMAIGGVELALEHGTLAFIPAELSDAFYETNWAPEGAPFWEAAAAKALVDKFDGIVLVSHPFNRDLGFAMGDRVYDLRGLGAVETRVGIGGVSWDTLADQLASTLQLARLGSCSGDAKRIGCAATVMPECEEQGDVIAALKAGKAFPVEFDEGKGMPRVAIAPKGPEPRRPRDDDRGGGRGGPRREGGGGGRGGPRREGGGGGRGRR